ncbi:hypothetical protein ACFMQL_14960 [Nonomuraea fastidiosa]|uniref:hypothetical protein n=1 Tax=Nonomuraea TaxID=83681 RepID=UPI0034481EAD
MGLARLALLVVTALAVVALLFVGGRALLGMLGDAAGETARERSSPAPDGGTEADTQADAETDAETGAETPSASARVPTVRIECIAETCPLVTVRVPGGDVLLYRDMARGEEVSYFEPELDVVLSDAATVRVTENGELRPQGAPGKREAFTATAPD